MIRSTTIAFLVCATPALAIDIQEVTSPGGIKAWLVEEPAIPFTALEIRFQGGASVEDPAQRGVTNLMMGLLEEGAGDMDARAFAEAREAIAARYGFDAYDDTITISAEFLTQYRDASVDLLRQALIAPRFDQAAIDRVKGQVYSAIASDAQDPDEISSSTYFELAFGDHPYGSDLNGTRDSLEPLTAEDLEAARQASLTLDRVYVGAVGNITAQELGPLLDRLLGDLPRTGAALPPDIDYALPGGTTVIDYDSPQSTALFGHGGIARDDEDFFAAYILNHIFGGAGLESRLSQEVREKRGLTYGISTFLVPKDHAEMVLGRVRSSNDRIEQAIDLIKLEWARIAETGISEAELTEAKTYLTGAYPLRFDGNKTIANILAGMQMEGLGLDYIPTRNDQVNAVTLADVNRVARELLRPEDLHFVVVGRPEGLETTN